MSNSTVGNRYSMLISVYARWFFGFRKIIRVASVVSNWTVFAESSRIHTKLVPSCKIYLMSVGRVGNKC